MPAKFIKFSYPVPSNKNGQAFASADDLLIVLDGESSGQFLVGSQGMWHGGIHITDATVPWCALSTDSVAEKAYYNTTPHKGEQFIRCMADGEIVAFRVCKDYDSDALAWRNEKLQMSTSFVLVKHYLQPGENADSGLTFYTLYMNLAPFSAYTTGNAPERMTAGAQRYYATKEDVQAPHGGNVAGTLAKDTRVILGDSIISRESDKRQFTEVTLAAETKNAAGETLAAGTKIWTVSDRGALKSPTSAVPVPPWWARCSPVYGTQPAGGVNCTSRTNWAYYLSSDDVLQRNKAGDLTPGFPLTYEPGNAAQQLTRPGKTPAEPERKFSLATLGRKLGKLEKGDRIWVVSDGDSLTPVTTASSSTQPVFGDVVIPSAPVEMQAGDGIGHMGFYQLPEETGKRSRYQVHIECLSMDDIAKFITNPAREGETAPLYLTYAKDAELFDKGTDAMAASTRKTREAGIVTLSKVPTLGADGKTVPANGTAGYYQIYRENGWLPATNVKKVPQYALDERGFITLDKDPESFDLIDGVKHPDNVVKGILEQLYKAAQDEPRTSHALNQYNYKRLLDLIDENHDGHYAEEEYLQAVHNPSYRVHLHRIIAKHASEWYYGKDDPLWATYLNTLTTDAPLWKTYTEAFIDKLTWMKKVDGMGPKVWHMHPVVFLEAFNEGGYDFSTREGTIRAIISECRKQGITLNTQIAYILATVKRETGDTFKPVREGDWVGHTSSDDYRRNHFRYYPYYGRGYVQITWDYNYRKYSEKLGVDLYNNPDLAMEPNNSLFILVDGFKFGVFSGKKISDYINNTATDFYNARRCINGTDHAEEIKGFANSFLVDLNNGVLE